MFLPFDWGHPTSPTIADAAALCLQTYDGETAFTLRQGQVRIKVGSVTITATGSTVTIDTPGDTIVFR